MVLAFDDFMKKTHPKSRPPPMPMRKARQLVEKIIQACHSYEQGTINIRQLWCRIRGHQRYTAVQTVKLTDDHLATRLLFLLLDVISWYGDHNELVANSAIHISHYVKRHPVEFVDDEIAD